MNNLEFDHADIFPDLAAIQTQFHHLVRTVPGNGRIIFPAEDQNLAAVLDRGCWTEKSSFSITGLGQNADSSAGWSAELIAADGSHFKVVAPENSSGNCPSAEVNWQMTGVHSVSNALAAMMAAHHVGVVLPVAAQALASFGGVKRRMELLDDSQGVRVYDDFAHHPTAIATTLDGLRKQVGAEPIIALIEPRSNTMKMGVHKATLLGSAEAADSVLWSNLSSISWLPELVTNERGSRADVSGLPKHQCEDTVEKLLAETMRRVAQYKQYAPDQKVHVVIMSNGGFAGIHQKLIAQLNVQPRAQLRAQL